MNGIVDLTGLTNATLLHWTAYGSAFVGLAVANLQEVVLPENKISREFNVEQNFEQIGKRNMLHKPADSTKSAMHFLRSTAFLLNFKFQGLHAT